MKHLVYLVAVSASLLGCWGCTGKVIDMDPEWTADQEAAIGDESSIDTGTTGDDGQGTDPCANVECNPGVICPEDGPCAPCYCCPCSSDSATVCDPVDPHRYWECNDDCYYEEYCPNEEVCVWESFDDTQCRDSNELVDGICQEPFEFDPDCYECDQCDVPGVSYCDYGIGSDAVARCDYDQFGRICWFRDPCDLGAECVQGYRTNTAQCGNEINDFDCVFLGCTGATPYCDAPGPGAGGWEEECGPCGCCYASEGDLCLHLDQGSVRLRSHQDDDDGFQEACFEWDPCPPGKLCHLDDDGDARCD